MLISPVTQRLLNQQLAAPQFSLPEDVVSHFGAMQAQEYRLMRWAVAMRTKKPSMEAFKAAYDGGKIIRTHLLRGTWQLVAAADYRWLHALVAPKARTTITGWMKANHIDIPQKEVDTIRQILCETAAEKRSASKEDFAEALISKGLQMNNHRLSYHIRFAELDGVFCSGNLLPMKATYALTSDKLGDTSPLPNRDEALSLLARKYFQSHSPATLEDYIWWTGLNISDCRRGIELLGNELHIEKWKDYSFYIHESCRTRGGHKGEILLLPSYDEYLLGYKSRELVLAPEHRAKAHNNSGNFYPIIVCDGIVCGNWSPFKKQLEASFFESERTEELLCEAWKRWQTFFNA